MWGHNPNECECCGNGIKYIPKEVVIYDPNECKKHISLKVRNQISGLELTIKRLTREVEDLQRENKSLQKYKQVIEELLDNK